MYNREARISYHDLCKSYIITDIDYIALIKHACRHSLVLYVHVHVTVIS